MPLGCEDQRIKEVRVGHRSAMPFDLDPQEMGLVRLMGIATRYDTSRPISEAVNVVLVKVVVHTGFIRLAGINVMRALNVHWRVT